MNKIYQKLIWILVPLFFGLQIWLVRMTYDLEKRVSIEETSEKDSRDLARETFKKVDANYTVLQSKADSKENNEAHNKIEEKVDAIDHKIDRLRMRGYTSMISDTVKQSILEKMTITIDKNTVVVKENSEKLDTIKYILIGGAISIFPVKETSIIEETEEATNIYHYE